MFLRIRTSFRLAAGAAARQSSDAHASLALLNRAQIRFVQRRTVLSACHSPARFSRIRRARCLAPRTTRGGPHQRRQRVVRQPCQPDPSMRPRRPPPPATGRAYTAPPIPEATGCGARSPGRDRSRAGSLLSPAPWYGRRGSPGRAPLGQVWSPLAPARQDARRGTRRVFHFFWLRELLIEPAAELSWALDLDRLPHFRQQHLERGHDGDSGSRRRSSAIASASGSSPFSGARMVRL